MPHNYMMGFAGLHPESCVDCIVQHWHSSSFLIQMDVRELSSTTEQTCLVAFTLETN
ncbi:hypothetical protein K503DRAFT_115330 [Rhizopogon vinicolor AM-OR11-026]|uniref:Uncharacterized protein n=1 Tax=Rhizopogon vinicolor AM-OR11-026 TaxID=1314800 RepID=A0A1B7MEX7_9AGAM|nr:hypothetical protein K503DRAFT_115330 [Rhizopogon vinicolor AM-OR11-026]